ncbi:hypothetical protein ACH5RR_039593 [Cinchona calisaya]|uniref:Uncharacterized protein n=1 Tax=Cinchona calisaya TaxID=153742 RepID=A0ABD2Y3W8_9GENT
MFAFPQVTNSPPQKSSFAKAKNFQENIAMSIKRWNKSRSASVRLGQADINREYEAQPRWLKFWTKFRRHKKKNSNSSMSMQTPYDPKTYLQNFDEGSGTLEPDNLFRSFSARFADPSSLSRRKDFLDF